jgi:D-amino-acid dehydrogenase
MSRSVIVLGAGMIGVSIALHLQRRGAQVVVLDRAPPGEGASFGNAGLIQREAVYPHPFPRPCSNIGGTPRHHAIGPLRKPMRG